MNIEKLSKDHFLIKSLVETYREEWQRKQGQRDKEKRQRFYMSDVGKCDREIYYLFHNPEKKRTIADRTIIFFRHGNLYHEEIQFRLKKSRVVDTSRDLEYGLEDFEIETTGRLDSFVSENSGLAVTEIKSKNPYQYKAKEPAQEETDQLIWYIFAAKQSKSLRKRNILDYGYILYAERGETDDFPFKGWKVRYDEQRIQGIRERFKKLWLAIQAKELPQRQHERKSIKCEYCRFRDFCWEGVPEIPTPELQSDSSIEKPEQELVESVEKRFVELKKQKDRIEDEMENLSEILIKYFKATGINETEFLRHRFSPHISLDEQYLLENLKDKWPLIAKAQLKLIQEAIKRGEVDPEILERAKKITFTDSIIIKKEAKNADKKSE